MTCPLMKWGRAWDPILTCSFYIVSGLRSQQGALHGCFLPMEMYRKKLFAFGLTCKRHLGHDYCVVTKKLKLLFMGFHVGSLIFHIIMIVAKNNIPRKRKARSNTRHGFNDPALGVTNLEILPSANTSSILYKVMGVTKGKLLERLKELQVNFSLYKHPVILTVEEGDRKQRFYLVSALKNTKVNIKVLSQRLSLGKGGLRMAPSEALSVQVPLGCVTPFAVVNESARYVYIIISPILYMLAAINSNDLDTFLKPIGRDPSYVDFEASPLVGKDYPPDLAALVPSGSINLPDQPAKQPSSQVPTDTNHGSGDNESKMISVKAVKSYVNGKNTTVKPVKKAQSSGNFADVELFVEETLHKTSRLLIAQIKENTTIKQHGENLGAVMGDNLRKGLISDLANLASTFKNTAYAEGFHTGSHYQPRCL
ncbi:unnamed protein product [Sphenostylis stenocarpa]|uniref:YbaK/aminoacyl-tRNA synthetase-associated domain-containing protein n=1 Tax=Sphenostylis stenocarpa TaxID=92480 RepID=A0AA86SVW6_9FABA|nr:unnamed protein product [Sphenostylis stenocarpa]